jgi:general secretion pathway protein H
VAPARTVRDTRRARGVTLVELLVVAAIASILLALTFPSIRAGMNTLSLRSSAQRLASAAKFARDQAIYRQRPFALEIDPDAGSITVIDSAGESHSFDLPDGVHVGAMLPQQSQPGKRVRSFIFTPDGASPVLDITLETARQRVQVSTDALTGFPRVTEL